MVPALLRALARYGAPVSILSESAVPPMAAPVSTSGPPLLMAWVVNSRSAGRAVGRYLLAAGHRRVAYISAQHDSDWSELRLAGLRDVVEPAGSVRNFTSVNPHTSPQLESDAQAAMRQTVLPRLRAALMEPAMRGLPPAVRERLWTRVVSPISTQVDWTLREVLGPVRDLAPLARQALADPSITAWVAGNIITTLACHDLLVASDVRVPRDISLVGFDDSAEAAVQGLTTYAFDAEAGVHACLSHILGPPGVRPREPVVDVPGYINFRRSSGPARRRTGDGA
jgi:DNA-binding LacI/PurR family transcriptional regulator